MDFHSVACYSSKILLLVILKAFRPNDKQPPKKKLVWIFNLFKIEKLKLVLLYSSRCFYLLIPSISNTGLWYSWLVKVDDTSPLKKKTWFSIAMFDRLFRLVVPIWQEMKSSHRHVGQLRDLQPLIDFKCAPQKKQGGNQQMLEVRPKKGVEEVGKNGGVVYRKRWGRSQKRASSMNRNPTKQ